VKDNFIYARLAQLIGVRTSLTEDKLPEMAKICLDDEEMARAVYDASKTSMGMDVSEYDLANVEQFTCERRCCPTHRHSHHLTGAAHLLALPPSPLIVVPQPAWWVWRSTGTCCPITWRPK